MPNIFYSSTAALFLALSAAPTLQADPFIPASDTVVVETLPRGLSKISRRESRSAPDVLKTAREYIELGQLHGEPRYVHFAEGLLARAPEGLEKQFLHGVILQYRHQWDAARTCFQDALKIAPNDSRILLQLAMLHIVQGRFEDARQIFARHTHLLGNPEAVTILAIVSSLSGQLRQSTTLVENQLSRLDPADADVAWTAATLAEMEIRRGDLATAETHLNLARKLSPESIPFRVQWADLLLLSHRYTEVAALAEGHPTHTGLILRIAIALKHLPEKQEAFASLRKELAERLTSPSGPRHLRETALYLLEIADQPKAALEAALQNFEQQREPIDAWLVLASAARAGDPARSASVTSWLKETKLEDVSLQKFIPLPN